MKIKHAQIPYIDEYDSLEGGPYWIDSKKSFEAKPSVSLFRLNFKCQKDFNAKLFVSADNRYRLFLDGKQIGRGPERGDKANWCVDAYSELITKGEHCFSAMVWWLGDFAPYAQESYRKGFLLFGSENINDIIATGIAPWEAFDLSAINFVDPEAAWGSGGRIEIDGNQYPWEWESGKANVDWQQAIKIAPASGRKSNDGIPTQWRLKSSELPAMLEENIPLAKVRHADSGTPQTIEPENNICPEIESWQKLLDKGTPLVIPKGECRRIIIDMDNYFCGYHTITISGGSESAIQVRLSEAPHDKDNRHIKGNRNEVYGKVFSGPADKYITDGGDNRQFMPLWWEAGRYIEILIKTGGQALTINSLNFIKTNFPFSRDNQFTCSDEHLNKLFPILNRTFECCSHETFMDCPYYEQLMYVGDLCTEAMVNYVYSYDTSLVKKSLAMFDQSRFTNGLTQSRYPSRVAQAIPLYSALWIYAVHNHFMWRGDFDFIKSLMPGVRAVGEYFRSLPITNGLLYGMDGWNFVDWAEEWDRGVPGSEEANSITNLLVSFCIKLKAEMEKYFGEELLYERDMEFSRKLADAVKANCYNPLTGLITDSPKKFQFSEHAQSMAVLCGAFSQKENRQIISGLEDNRKFVCSSFYFSHFLFEALFRTGNGEKILPRLSRWKELESLGLKTIIERDEPSRSDCHAWGTHPLFHFYASILGIRPAAPGFKQIVIAPNLGELQEASGFIPHKHGKISVSLKKTKNEINARINLPKNLHGDLIISGTHVKLKEGLNDYTTNSLPSAAPF